MGLTPLKGWPSAELLSEFSQFPQTNGVIGYAAIAPIARPLGSHFASHFAVDTAFARGHDAAMGDPLDVLNNPDKLMGNRPLPRVEAKPREPDPSIMWDCFCGNRVLAHNKYCPRCGRSGVAQGARVGRPARATLPFPTRF